MKQSNNVVEMSAWREDIDDDETAIDMSQFSEEEIDALAIADAEDIMTEWSNRVDEDIRELLDVGSMYMDPEFKRDYCMMVVSMNSMVCRGNGLDHPLHPIVDRVISVADNNRIRFNYERFDFVDVPE